VGVAGWEGLQRLTGVMRPGGLELTERALRASRLSAGSRVLDVGCGAGASLALLAQWNLVGVGVDVMPLVGQPGAAGGAPRLVQAGGQRLPLRERSFDAVLAECSLSLMPVRGALAEFARVLRPGGRLLLSDLYLRRPEQAPALRALALDGCLAGARGRDEWISLLGDAGFAVLEWEDHSAALRQTVGQWMMAGGAPEQLWCGGASCCSLDAVEQVRAAVAAARPGYYLLVAAYRGASAVHGEDQ